MKNKFLNLFAFLMMVSWMPMNATEYTIGPTDAVQAALDKLVQGDILWLEAGTYNIASDLKFDKIGVDNTTENFFKIMAKPGASVIWDGGRSTTTLVRVTGNWYYLKGVTIQNSSDNGLRCGGSSSALVGGSHNTFVNCVFRWNGDSGVQIGRSSGSNTNDGNYAAYNVFINCDSYANCDGGNADGFACKLRPGKGNVFSGCRLWWNSDDAFDFYYSDYQIIVENCWISHHGETLSENGSWTCGKAGNGNGVKVGGGTAPGRSHGPHIVRNCVVFDHKYSSSNNKGIDQNHDLSGVKTYNCLSFDNEYNYAFQETPDDVNNPKHILRNNVSFAPVYTPVNAAVDAQHHLWKCDWSDSNVITTCSNTDDQYNTWNLGITASAADYKTLSFDAMRAPREVDGSLPNNGFARLVAGSQLIDKGIDVGLPYIGAAPDLGPFEFDPATGESKIVDFQSVKFLCYPTVVTSQLSIESNLIDVTDTQIRVIDVAGNVVLNVTRTFDFVADVMTTDLSYLKAGVYTVIVDYKGDTEHFKIIKK